MSRKSQEYQRRRVLEVFEEITAESRREADARQAALEHHPGYQAMLADPEFQALKAEYDGKYAQYWAELEQFHGRFREDMTPAELAKADSLHWALQRLVAEFLQATLDMRRHYEVPENPLAFRHSSGADASLVGVAGVNGQPQPLPAAGQPAHTDPPKESPPNGADRHGETIPIPPEPLTVTEEAVYKVIVSHGPVTGAKITQRTGVDQSTLTSRIIPKLKQSRGIVNKRGAGYYSPRHYSPQ